MPRKRRPLIRESAERDARLIIIATEDTKAAVSYFTALASPRYYQSSKVQVKMLKRDNNASSPKHVLSQLEEWINEYRVEEDDELWVVIDVDSWKESELSDVRSNMSSEKYPVSHQQPGYRNLVLASSIRYYCL